MKHSGELVPEIVYKRIVESAMNAFTGSEGGLDTGTIGIFAPRDNETLKENSNQDYKDMEQMKML